jgi:hypothetical protein
MTDERHPQLARHAFGRLPAALQLGEFGVPHGALLPPATLTYRVAGTSADQSV